MPGIIQFDRLAADPTAFDGQEVTVLGSMIEIGGAVVLCAALAEVRPDGCTDLRLTLVGPIPADLAGQTVTVRGVFRSAGDPPAMRLEVIEVRPAGA